MKDEANEVVGGACGTSASEPEGSCSTRAGEDGDALGNARAPLTREDWLYVPHCKRMTASYEMNEEGTRELRLDCGSKEITFDEERLFPFGEKLAKQISFSAEQATTWGAGYEWEEVSALLESLLDEGILRSGEAKDEDGAQIAATD